MLLFATQKMCYACQQTVINFVVNLGGGGGRDLLDMACCLSVQVKFKYTCVGVDEAFLT